jgi:chromatin structure-remodeling complex subunit RSC9
MFYEVEWTISNDPDFDDGEIGELDGLNGTADILERIAQLKRKDVQDNFQPAEFTDQLMLVTEAVLTIRNMVMLPENAWFIADYPPVKDLICILLHLPPMDVAVELKHSALDIAEQITPYLILDSEDPLYQTLLMQLQSSDRGIILTALRAISRIAMNHPTETNKLGDVPPTTLQSLMDWLMLNDDELVDACLDFLYQYTAVVSNLDVMLEGTKVEHLVVHLVRLLSHGAKRYQRDIVVSEARLVYEPASEQVVPIPRDLQERLLAMEEPERCFAWLRCFFEEDPEAQITQIAIWQAYNASFLESLKRIGRTMINAPEFIRHISTVYSNAGAQVIREANGESQKFIMRGIRPRVFPVTTDGRGYFQCQWQRAPGQHIKCGTWNISTEKMWEHILTDHLNETPGEDGKYQNREATYACAWDGCTKYHKPTTLHLAQFMTHIKTHLKAEEAERAAAAATTAAQQADLPSSSHGGGSGASASSSPSKRASVSSAGGGGGGGGNNSSSSSRARVVRPQKTITLTFEDTASVRDERNANAPPQAAGIPLSAALILRNIARNVVKTAAEERLVKRVKGAGDDEEDDNDGGGDDKAGEDKTAGGGSEAKNEDGGWNERLFRPVMPRLWEVFTENRVLAPYVTSLFQLLEKERAGFAFDG